MIKKFKIFLGACGFTLLEILVSITIFSMILMVLIYSFLSVNASNLKTAAGRETLENSQRALQEIAYEIRSAESIYTPTTTENQLSLETSRYLPAGQNKTFIDFFLCGNAICLKKESQDAIALTPASINVTNLTFSQISTGAKTSVKVDLTANYSTPNTLTAPVSLTSVASLRSY